MVSFICSRKSSYMKISEVANSFFQWPAISFSYVEFRRHLKPADIRAWCQLQPAAQLWPNAARIPFKKADLAVRLVFHYLLNCGREVCRFLRGRSCLLAASTPRRTLARFSSRLPSCGASRYKAPFALLTKAQKQKPVPRPPLATYISFCQI